MTPSRPYLLRAFYQWIEDNHMTAYVLVDALCPGADVPNQYIEDGQIVLNIAARAVQELSLENESVTFSARFNGMPHNIYIPMRAIKAIYAKENGKGMVFQEEDMPTPPETTKLTESEGRGDNTGSSGGSSSGKRSGRPNLTVVK